LRRRLHFMLQGIQDIAGGPRGNVVHARTALR
jgi:hypothetical protein